MSVLSKGRVRPVPTDFTFPGSPPGKEIAATIYLCQNNLYKGFMHFRLGAGI